MSVVQFREWGDFRRAGIDYLTGEACGLSLRGLCDLTERGRRLVCKAFGLVNNNPLNENWNSGSKSEPHVASIMLNHDMLPTLSVFACLETPGVQVCFVVYTKDKNWEGTYGFGRGDEEIADWQACMTGFGCNMRRFDYGGTAGDRNRHEMSGRVS